MRRGIHRTFFTAAAVSAALLAPFLRGPAASADEPSWQTRMEQKAATVVSVKFVLKMHLSFGGQSQDQETNGEARGVVVDAAGLVMLSNASLEGDSSGGVMQRMMKRGGAGFEMNATPSDLKVLFGSEAKEYPAVVVARDSNLGLAFVRILDLEGKKPDVVDLSKGAAPEVGWNLFGVTRRARGFDCAPEVGRLFVSGRVEKPRAMWGVTGDFSGLGLPVYGMDGVPVGVLSTQQGVDSGEESGPGGMAGLLTGGADASGTFLLPLDVVSKSLEAAKKRVPEALEKAAKAKEAATKEGEGEKPKDAPPKDAPPKDAPKDEKPGDAPKPPDGPK